MIPFGLSLVFLSLILLPPLLHLWWMKRLPESLKFPPPPPRWPSISILIPTYQEANVIERKLRNLSKLRYRGKLEVILIDSGSTDGTLEVVQKSVKGFPWRILLLKEEKKRGKAKALNLALKEARGEIIATSDADALWRPETVESAVRYLSLPGVGAVTGREKYLNAGENLWTRAEERYRRLYEVLRIGESNLHSCLSFQGALAFYRRELLSRFEEREAPDDTGTALEICAQGYRCLMVPDLVFMDTAPSTLRAFLRVKTRRGLHMLLGLKKAVELKRKGRLPVSWAILLANLYLYFFLPAFLLLFFVLFLLSLPRSLYLLLLFPPFLVKKGTRAFLIGFLLSALCLLHALSLLLKGEKMTSWEKWR